MLVNVHDPLASFGLTKLPIGVSIRSSVGWFYFEFERPSGGEWSRTVEVLGRPIDGKSQAEFAAALKEILRQIPK